MKENVNKRYFTKAEMIYVLEKRGLIVDKPKILDEISYAYLIYEFSDPFYKEPKEYKKGTKLSHIYNLYLFSKKFSLFAFDFIHDIEIKFKKIVASLASTEVAYSYLEEGSYKFDSNDKVFHNFFKKLKVTHDTYVRANFDFIESKMEKGIAPIWIFLHKISLSDLIKFVKYNKGLIHADPYVLINLSWKQIAIINKFRNQIAHMNPVRLQIRFSTQKSVGVVRYQDLFEALHKAVPNIDKKFKWFWVKNKKYLSRAIFNRAKKLFFNFNPDA